MFPVIKLDKNKAPIVKFIMHKTTYPINVGFFLPYLDSTGTEKNTAASWTMFATNGVYKESVGLRLLKITPHSVTTIFVPLNCCMK